MMSLTQRLLSVVPFIAALAVWFSVERWPRVYLWVAPATLALLCVCVGLLAKRSPRSVDYWHFLLAPFTLTLSGLTYVLFLDSEWLRATVLVTSGFGVAWYLQNLGTFLYQTSSYQPYALENISSYLNLIAAFFLYASFFSLRLFLSWPLSVTALLTAGFTALLAYQMSWVNKLAWKRSLPFILVLALVQAEAFLTIQFLPTVSAVNALLLATVLYALISLTRLHLLSGLERRFVQRYVGIATTVFVITIFTARWS
jgi:hypothetical protein